MWLLAAATISMLMRTGGSSSDISVGGEVPVSADTPILLGVADIGGEREREREASQKLIADKHGLPAL